MKCDPKKKGVNVISAAYEPANLKMWAGFEYGYNQTFTGACCGVYVEMDMSRWLVDKKNLHS